MSMVVLLRNYFYVMALILALKKDYLFTVEGNVLSMNTEDYRTIGFKNVFIHDIDVDDFDDEENNYDSDKIIITEKRDVIKGPSFIQNIDETIADKDIEKENKEVAEGLIRLAFKKEPSKDINLSTKHHLESQRGSRKSSTKGPDISFIKEFSNLIDIEKLKSEKSTPVDTKKNMMGKPEISDELPTKYIKALYEWNRNPKSTITSNKTLSSDRYRFDSIILPEKTHKKSENYESIIKGVSETFPPIVNEHTSSNLVNAEPVVPPPQSLKIGSKMPTMSDYSAEQDKLHFLSKKSKQKINVLVNVNINGSPNKRSKHGDSLKNTGLNYFEHPVITQRAEKRHFPFFDPNTLKPNKESPKQLHKRKETSKDSDIASGEGSGSGIGDTKQPSAFSKIPTDFNNTSHKTIAGFTYPVGDHGVLDKNENLEEESDEDEDNDSSGSGQIKLKINLSKNHSTKKYGMSGRNRIKQHKKRKISQNTITENDGKNLYEAANKNIDAKYDEKMDAADTGNSKEIKTVPNSSSSKSGLNEAFPQSKELLEVETIPDEKNKSVTRQKSSTDQSEDIIVSGKDIADKNPNEAKDNLERKSASQEDKYETLEEVREKFKTWQSKITENNSFSPTIEETKTNEKISEELSKKEKNELLVKAVAAKLALGKDVEREEKLDEDNSKSVDDTKFKVISDEKPSVPWKAVDETIQKLPIVYDEKMSTPLKEMDETKPKLSVELEENPLGFFKENKTEDIKEKEGGELRRKDSTELKEKHDDDFKEKEEEPKNKYSDEFTEKQEDLKLKQNDDFKGKLEETHEKHIDEYKEKQLGESKEKHIEEFKEKQQEDFKQKYNEETKDKQPEELKGKQTVESKQKQDESTDKHIDEYKEKQPEEFKERHTDQLKKKQEDESNDKHGDESKEKIEEFKEDEFKKGSSKDRSLEENRLKIKDTTERKITETAENQGEDLKDEGMKLEAKEGQFDGIKEGTFENESKFDDMKSSSTFKERQPIFEEKQPDEFVKELIGVFPKEHGKVVENLDKNYKEELDTTHEKKHKNSNHDHYKEKTSNKLKNPLLDESGKFSMEEGEETNHGNKLVTGKTEGEMKLKEDEEKDTKLENNIDASNVQHSDKSSPSENSISYDYRNEQDSSFSAVLEKIKEREKKMEKEKAIQDEKKYISSKISSFKDTTKQLQAKKPTKKNLKKIRIYKQQILSEVQKIDNLMNEYHKDGHNTRELGEAKIVLENDLKLVKNLEKNMKKNESSKRKHKVIPVSSSSYFASSNHLDYNEYLAPKKTTEQSGDEKVATKSEHKSLKNNKGKVTGKFEEKSEEQLTKLIPSYEYYFHSEPKTTPKVALKHEHKQSLDEVHKLLKAEIKRLKEKKNARADSQLKNIRKLVQQHLKKLISSGDIDKAAFHSLAPAIKELGELLKARIKKLKKKKKKQRHRKKIRKEGSSFQKSISPKTKENNVHDTAELRESSSGKIKEDSKSVDSSLYNRISSTLVSSHQLEPPLSEVKGSSQPTTLVSGSDQSQFNNSLLLSVSGAIGGPHKSTQAENENSANDGMDQAQKINMKSLLKTLNEKLGTIYQKAKTVQDSSFVTQSSPLSPDQPNPSSPPIEQPQRDVVDSPRVIGVNQESTQTYRSQKPNNGELIGSNNVPTPDAAQRKSEAVVNNVASETQSMVETNPVAVENTPSVYLNTPTETETVPLGQAQAQNTQTSQTPTPPQPVKGESVPGEPGQTESTPSQETQSASAMTQASEQSTENSMVDSPSENKDDLPMVPLEPDFEEDKAEPLAQLEPINTLVETLERDITELWSYKDIYPNAEALGLDNEKVHNTYANLGSLSGLSLRRALNRALRGEDVGLGVVGGSISKGGPFSEKGLEYVLRSYFYAIEDYWNKVIRPVTGSSMIVRDISLGGISTDYYSYCLRNHLPDDRLTNIVLWELSANDMRRYDDSVKPKTQPLEQFTRNILSYRAKPALIFVNFFALFDWDPDLRSNCRNFEDEGEDDVAKYYKITSLSWRNMVCPLLKTENQPLFNRDNLFSEDHFHPSILGHAQMSYIIIDYIRTEFLKNLVKMRPFFIGDAVDKLQVPKSVYMPRPMYKETFLWKPLCYTYMLVDSHLPNNSIPLHEENDSDFKYAIVRGFKIRSDKIAGMETKIKDQFIRYKMEIPRHENGGTDPFKQLGIMSFTDDRYAEVQFDSEHPTRLEAKKRFLEGTVIKTVAENIEPGEHTLTLRSGDNGFLICALILG